MSGRREPSGPSRLCVLHDTLCIEKIRLPRNGRKRTNITTEGHPVGKRKYEREPMYSATTTKMCFQRTSTNR